MSKYLFKYLCLFMLFTSCFCLQGQELKLDSYLEVDSQKVEHTIQVIGIDSPSFSQARSYSNNPSHMSPVYLPDYARKNPTGYSYLCRLELKIEKELPLGLWLDLGDTRTWGNPSQANANVRFRFKLR
jgi:hypothetical protein